MKNGYYVYRFKNKNNEIIYVGKTINLKNRFRQHSHLTKDVKKIEYIECDSEADMTWKEIYYINLFKNNNTTNIASVCKDMSTQYDFGDVWKEYNIDKDLNICNEFKIKENADGSVYYHDPNAKYIDPDKIYSFEKYTDNMDINDKYVVSFEDCICTLPCYYSGNGYKLNRDGELLEETSETLRNAAIYSREDARNVAKILNKNAKLLYNVTFNSAYRYRAVPFTFHVDIDEDEQISKRFIANKEKMTGGAHIIPEFIDENGIPDQDYLTFANGMFDILLIKRKTY